MRSRGLSLELEFGLTIDLEDWDDDFEESSTEERETTEEEVIDLATAARTITELQAEIDHLGELENLALRVRRSGKDRKWEELSKLLQDQAEMFDAGGYRRKLVIFTEHRDTLNYLTERIGTLLGRPEAIVTIHGGKVFDVLGKAIAGKELRELLIEAIRYGDREDIKAKLNQVVADRLDQGRLRELLEERALARDSMDATKVQQIREDMERAEARKLQPHFIASFFLAAFQRLGGTIRQREPKRYEITHVPAVIRNRDRQISIGDPILRRYERVCFEKELISVPGKPLADFICPGHPILDATLDLTLERHRDLLRQGAILVDQNDPGEAVRALVYRISNGESPRDLSEG